MNIFIMLELKASFVSLICNNNTIITHTYEALFVYQALIAQTALSARVHLILSIVLLVR